MPDAATISIGGITILSIHMVIMSQIRKLTIVGTRLDRWFDWINHPIAFILVGIANPPWPLYSWDAWQSYVGLSLALATLASVTAKKMADAKPRNGNGQKTVGNGV